MNHNTPTPGNEAPLQLGQRIRQLRKRQGLTLARLAASSGLSIGHISLIERNLTQPSINALVNLSRSLGVTVQWFFSGPEALVDAEKDYVVRHDGRPRLDYQQGFVDHLLTPRSQRQLEMIHSLIPPGASSEEGYSHQGEEAGFILKGVLELQVGERQFHLEAGDSFAFSSQETHRYRNPGSSDTIVIWVITPAGY